mgnify:CR=1 FL=1
MPRWPEDSRTRLVDAAMSLFGEHGYGATTVDEIAARAGVTARTFFRHFPDKEEALFAEDDEMLPLMLATIGEGTEPVTAEALMQRVFGAGHAGVLSAIGFALFSRTLHAWLAEPGGATLSDRLRDALPRVRTVLDEVSAGRAAPAS